MTTKIVINSNVKFASVSLPPLLDSLKSAGFTDDEILIFVGGDISEVSRNTKNIFYVKHDSIDFTGLIELSRSDYGADFFFYMHDTVKVGPKFRDKLFSVDPKSSEIIPLRPWPSMNTGLYSGEYLKRKQVELLAIQNFDISIEGLQKAKKWGVYHEDFLTWRQENMVANSYADLLGSDSGGVPVTIGEYDYYGNGVKRRLEYYDFLDFYKVKSNWELRESYELRL
jgi:hypothetical protein